MKKFWIYVAMPVALLNGCQRQQAVLDEAESLTVESSVNGKGSSNALNQEESQGTGGDELSDPMDETKDQEDREESGTSGYEEETWDDSLPQGSAGKPASVVLSQNCVKEAPFDGSTVSIVRSGKEEASQITEAEIEAMVREAAGDFDTVVKNGQTVVIKPNLVQMIVDSTGEKLDRQVNGVTTDWRGAESGWEGVHHGGFRHRAYQGCDGIFSLHGRVYGGRGRIYLSGGGLRCLAGF